jgi:hypothetical protein
MPHIPREDIEAAALASVLAGERRRERAAQVERLTAEVSALRAENARLRYQMQGRTFVAEQPGPLERLEAWARENPHIEPGIGRNYGTKGQPVGWYVSIPGCCIGIERTLAAAIEAALKQVEVQA